MIPGIVVHTPGRRRWIEALSARIPEASITTLEECERPENVVAAFVWKSPPGAMARFPNLRFIQSFGHGVDALATDPTLPDVPVARLVDLGLAEAMARYVLHAALDHVLQAPHYRAAGASAEWSPRRALFPADFPMTVLGYGVIGSAIADLASAAGFPVRGWSRSAKEGVHPMFHGMDQLPDALDSAGVVVNILPFTTETSGLCNEGFFNLMRGPDALFVNVGRGGTVDEDALIGALDAGMVGRAVLDVTREEPLPPTSPLWQRPDVTITPHVAGPTDPERSADFVAANLLQAIRGEVPEHLVDLRRGY